MPMPMPSFNAFPSKCHFTKASAFAIAYPFLHAFALTCFSLCCVGCLNRYQTAFVPASAAATAVTHSADSTGTATTATTSQPQPPACRVDMLTLDGEEEVFRSESAAFAHRNSKGTSTSTGGSGGGGGTTAGTVWRGDRRRLALCLRKSKHTPGSRADFGASHTTRLVKSYGAVPLVLPFKRPQDGARSVSFGSDYMGLLRWYVCLSSGWWSGVGWSVVDRFLRNCKANANANTNTNINTNTNTTVQCQRYYAKWLLRMDIRVFGMYMGHGSCNI